MKDEEQSQPRRGGAGSGLKMGGGCTPGRSVGSPAHTPTRTHALPSQQIIAKRIVVKNANGVLQTVRFTLQNMPPDGRRYMIQDSELTLPTGERTSIPTAIEIQFMQANSIKEWEFEPDLTAVHPALLPLTRKCLDGIEISIKMGKNTVALRSKFKKHKSESLQANAYNPSSYEYCNCLIWQTYLLNKRTQARRYSDVQERDQILQDGHKKIEDVIEWIKT